MLINKHPFEIWKSKKVLNLLLATWWANFKKTNIDYKVPLKFIQKVRDSKNIEDEEELILEGEGMFKNIKLNLKFASTEINELDLLDFSNIKSFLDIWANKLSTINYFAQKYENIEKFIWVDVIPQNKNFVDKDRSNYYQIDPMKWSTPIEDWTLDCINIQYVFHHAANIDEIKMILSISKKLLKKWWKLILREESFPVEDPDIDLLTKENNSFWIQTNAEYTEKFYNLSTIERREYIIVNDWLINVENRHMQWTGQYRSWKERKKLLSKHWFQLEKERNLWVRVNGHIKWWIHCIGQFIS